MPTRYFEATLVRGRVYILLGNGVKRQEFKRGKAAKVTDIIKAHLEKHAVDPVTEVDPLEHRPKQVFRQKFEFSAVDAPE